MTRPRLSAGLSVVTLAALAGCVRVGPEMLPHDRFDYSAAVAESWKEQTLLNIVKLRYMDTPIFLDVAQIVSGYSLETSVNIGGQVASPGAVQGDTLGLGAAGRFTDRPTITYTPLTGEKFLHGLLTPIKPANVFVLLQSGYAADFVLGLTVESLNGLRNRSAAAGQIRQADPEFTRVLTLMREVQAAGGVGMRVEVDPAGKDTTVFFIRRENLPPEILEKAAEIRRLLGVSPDQTRFRLVYSPMKAADDELAVNTRSMLQILGAFASLVEVPDDDVKEGRAVPSLKTDTDNQETAPPPIRCTAEKPADAFVAVQYRGRWFWIDDRDWRAKRAFTALLLFFTLIEGAAPENLPLVTIPAG